VYHRYSQDIHAKTPGALPTESDDVIDYDEDAGAGNVSSYTAQRQYLAQFGLRNNLLGISANIRSPFGKVRRSSAAIETRLRQVPQPN